MKTDTIAAIATGMSNSGIGIVRISGDEALQVISRIYRNNKGEPKDLGQVRSNTIHYDNIYDGEERQVAVLAFQLGDAFTNFIVPTSGCLLGALAAAKLEWGSWAKFQIKFQAVLVVFASLAVVLGVVIGLS